MKTGDRVKIVKGPYKGTNGVIKSRVTGTDQDGSRKPLWVIQVGPKEHLAAWESEIRPSKGGNHDEETNT